MTSLDSGTNVDEGDALSLNQVLERLNLTEFREKFEVEQIDLDTLVRPSPHPALALLKCP